MNALVILIGESFRLGSNKSRKVGLNKSYESQKDATNSHIRLFKFLKNKYNVNFDTIINTSPTKFDNELIDWYSVDTNVLSVKTDKYKGMYARHTYVRENQIPDLDEYDFVLILRLDVYIKQKLLEIFDPTSKKILFPFIVRWFSLEENYRRNHNSMKILQIKNEINGKTIKEKYLESMNSEYYPIVCDSVSFVPRNFFSVLGVGECNKQEHQPFYLSPLIGLKLLTEFNICSDSIGFLTNTFYFNDTELGKNPLYKLVGRNEAKTSGITWKIKK